MAASDTMNLLSDDPPQTEDYLVWRPFREEFRWSQLGFSYPKKNVFFMSQWRLPIWVFIGYRFVVAGYTLGVLTSTIIDEPFPMGFNFAVWLTNWAYTTLTLHLLLALIVAAFYNAGRNCCQPMTPGGAVPEISMSSHRESQGSSTTAVTSASDEEQNIEENRDSYQGQSTMGPIQVINPGPPFIIKLSWLLFAVISNVAPIVSLVYFTALYPQIYPKGQPPSLMDIQFHALNSVIIILELSVGAFPVRLMHAIYPLVYGLAYVIFSVIFWAVDHNNVLYPGVLDWNHPGWTCLVLAGLTFVGIPLIQLLLYSFYRLRTHIYLKCFSIPNI